MGLLDRLLGARAPQAYEAIGDHGFSDDEWHSAALHMIYPVNSGHPSWFGGTVDGCRQALSGIDGLRMRYASLEPPRLRKHVMGWLDYFEKEARENLHDCETGESRRELDEHRKKSDIERGRASLLLAKLRESGQADCRK